MLTSTDLLRRRRFLPLFVTQVLGAFNDNLYKNAMVLFVVYAVYSSAEQEFWFSAIAQALFTLPFVLFSALSGQLADMRDKAMIIRWVKIAEIGIMSVGATGLVLATLGIGVHAIAIPLLLLALFAMGLHSTFFGPIKYAILPQHLDRSEVLAGTGLVEAGTYLAVLGGTILAGWISAEVAAILVILLAMVGYATGRQVPPAPAQGAVEKIDFNIIRSSINVVKGSMEDARVYYAILAISLFWTIGAVLFIEFPPLAKNVLTASKEVASLFLVVFSIGVAIGSVSINALLKGDVSARFAPISVLAMGAFVVAFHLVCKAWVPHDRLYGVMEFIQLPLAAPLLLSLLGISIAGGMFVVPLYAFLTTVVDKSQTARAVAANNFVNSFAMVGGSGVAIGLNFIGISIVDQLLLAAAMCIVSAWLGWVLHKAELRLAPA
ncbi:MFS transporter [Croceicoccus mobilis]|uniref:2-acyl-glycerophospho-ethanolamine acyltransferase n=1 Tax=Croceicoccus mobilis TaxID=1703339 RepID=A0A916Z496_9SPHN|nr:MFS transporter [Croceicoccus mobilis]GGD76071.1 2-acyl-glycerophospho-ethanolamine acyltransferase [Croceicoccus mobilis]